MSQTPMTYLVTPPRRAAEEAPAAGPDPLAF